MDNNKSSHSPDAAALNGITLTSEELIKKLRGALKSGGDFPASAQVISELRQLTNDPKTTANQITEVILREPSLGTRVLHLVNSSFYRRAKAIMTVSQAVIQIGMRPLAELCAGLILLQKFVPVARRGGPFATCLQHTIVTSLLSGLLGQSGKNNKDEEGYLAATFSELGILLVAYYFPKIFEAAAQRAEIKHVTVSQAFFELLGITSLDLSIEVIDALELPDYYKEIICATAVIEGQPITSKAQSLKSMSLPGGSSSPQVKAESLFAARQLSTALTHAPDRRNVDQLLSNITHKIKLPEDTLHKALGKLPELFDDHCTMIQLSLPPLPEFVSSYIEHEGPTDQEVLESNNANDNFAKFVDEIRDAVEQHEPTASIITSVMETLAWGLEFERVLLLLVGPNKRNLVGRMVLGQVENCNPRDIIRSIDGSQNPYAPDAVAFTERRPVFQGDPILANGWPLAALPIGFGKRTIGVIYCDRIDADVDELDSRVQAAVGVLAELLDRSIGMN